MVFAVGLFSEHRGNDIAGVCGMAEDRVTGLFLSLLQGGYKSFQCSPRIFQQVLSSLVKFIENRIVSHG